MRSKDDFDLIVVGSGPAGEKGAAQAAYFGKRVAVVERSPVPGGIAVSTAGIPTKALRESAIHLSGLGQSPADLSERGSVLERLMSRKTEAVSVMTLAVRRNLTRHRVELVQGSARLQPDRSVAVTLASGELRVLRGQVVLLATGGRPIRPDWLPQGDPMVRDSETILDMKELPGSLLVIGEGAVGCEYASIFAALNVKVTLVCRTDRVLPTLDVESSRVLAESFNGLGIRVVPRSEVVSLVRQSSEGGGKLEATLSNGKTLSADMVLSAVGRGPSTVGLGLEEAGVLLAENGYVKVDGRFETTLPGVFAAGDLVGPPALASVAMEEARVAVCHAFGIEYKKTVDALCPTYVFTIPEVASVGLSEEAAKLAGIEYEVGRTAFAANAKARVTGFSDGFVKLVFRVSDQTLLGVHIVGEQASELIHLGQFVLRQGGTLDPFIQATFAVPTRAEAYKYAAYDGLMRLSRRVKKPVASRPAN